MNAHVSNWLLLKQCFNWRESLNNLLYQKKNGFATLDAFRAIGMMSVLMGHTLAAIGIYMSNKLDIALLEVLDATPGYVSFFVNAHYMVDFFFVLSGFLIAGILFREFDKNNIIRLKHFYYRRFMRLMPTYVFVVMVAYLLNAPLKEELWKNLLYINNFFPHKEGALPWTWSLAVEEQFYVLFPLLVSALFFYKRYFIFSLFILFLLSFLIRAFVVFDNPILASSQIYEQLINPELDKIYLGKLYDNLYTRYGAFLCGIYAAYLYRYNKESTNLFFQNSRLSLLLVVISLTLLAIISLTTWQKTQYFPQWFIQMFYISNRNIFSICITIIMLGTICNARSLNIMTKVLSAKFWYPFAQLTYAAYLIHLPVVVGVFYLLSTTIFNDIASLKWLLVTTFILASILTYFFSALIYIFLENPLMKWRDLRSGPSYRESIKKQTINSMN